MFEPVLAGFTTGFPQISRCCSLLQHHPRPGYDIPFFSCFLMITLSFSKVLKRCHNCATLILTRGGDFINKLNVYKLNF